MPKIPQLTIIGLGLIGGSLGLALRQAKAGYEIVGHNRRLEIATRAKQRGAIDRAEWSLFAAVETADVVVIATPLSAVRKIMEDIAPHLKKGCVVTDTASTKEKVVAWADELLPSEISFVGGHPMAGKELSGIEAAEADLFKGCTYCLVPSCKASATAVESVVKIANAIGARPYFMEANEHDSFAAAASHLPFVAATALVNSVTRSLSWGEISRLASSGFRDTSRLASGDSEMYKDICGTNRQSLLYWLDRYIVELKHMRHLIENDSDELEEVFRKAKDARDQWQSRHEQS